MNTNNTTNIRKTSKPFLDVPIETRRSCLMKKTSDTKKSRDTVPLSHHECFMLDCLFKGKETSQRFLIA
jgi:hypothetical protein